LSQLFDNAIKLFQCGFQVLGDFRCQNFRGWEVFCVFEAFVFEPENIQVSLVSLGQLGVGEGFEVVCWFAVVAVLCVVAFYEVLQALLRQHVTVVR